MTTPAENRETVQRATDAFNERDREAFDPCYAEEVVVHGRHEERRLDHDEHWEEVLGTFEAVPDLKATTESIVAEDDRVVVRWPHAGTPIAEAWQLSDTLQLYETLGVIEVPEE